MNKTGFALAINSKKRSNKNGIEHFFLFKVLELERLYVFSHIVVFILQQRNPKHDDKRLKYYLYLSWTIPH